MTKIVLENILVLDGYSIVPALSFLRDAFVAGLLLLLLERYGMVRVWLLVPVFVASLFDALDPVILRAPILFFMLAGALLWKHKQNLEVRSEFLFVTATLFGTLCALAATDITFSDQPKWVEEAWNIAKRSIVVAVFAYIAFLLARTRLYTFFQFLSARMYLCFLSHTLIFACLWFVWKKFVGDENSESYVFFFFGVPVVTLVLTIAAYQVISYFPRPVRILLRGKP